jgi:protein TonB
VFYLGQLQSTDANSAAIVPLSRDLSNKLLERARATAQAGKTGIDNDLNQAKRLGADPKDILAVQAIQNAPKASQPGGARPGAATGANLAALAASLKRTRYVAPEYPAKALAQKVAGAVTVEYTVAANGETRDVRIVESMPEGVFDRAALAAIKRWRYEPVVSGGGPVEIPVRTVIRFELPK